MMEEVDVDPTSDRGRKPMKQLTEQLTTGEQPIAPEFAPVGASAGGWADGGQRRSDPGWVSMDANVPSRSPNAGSTMMGASAVEKGGQAVRTSQPPCETIPMPTHGAEYEYTHFLPTNPLPLPPNHG